MEKKETEIIIVIAVIAVLLFGFFYLLKNKEKIQSKLNNKNGSSDDAKKEEPPKKPDYTNTNTNTNTNVNTDVFDIEKVKFPLKYASGFKPGMDREAVKKVQKGLNFVTHPTSWTVSSKVKLVEDGEFGKNTQERLFEITKKKEVSKEDFLKYK